MNQSTECAPFATENTATGREIHVYASSNLTSWAMQEGLGVFSSRIFFDFGTVALSLLFDN